MRLLLIVCLFLSGCIDDDALWKTSDQKVPPSGVWILNEGNFLSNNASLDLYEPDSRITYRNIFFNTNGFPLGDVAQSIHFFNDRAFIVVNNSGKIQEINPATHQLTQTITGLTSPRYMQMINENKAYVTDLYGRGISIVDPENGEVTGEIELISGNASFYRHSTEQIIRYGNFLLVNCWSFDDKILLIDTRTDELIDSLTVALQPNSMVLDKNNDLWVLSDGGYKGNPAGHENGGLTCIDIESFSIKKEILFPMDASPASLIKNASADTLYFISNDVFKMSIFDEEAKVWLTSPYAETYSGGFRTLAIDQVRNELYIADAIDYQQPGKVLRYTSAGQILDTIQTGIIPGFIDFYHNDQR